MKQNLLFRSWFYFRTGWQTYFAFILAAINTLTVTYFLAIDKYHSLQTIFPSFEIYILIIVSIGIPLLVLIGFIHFKRSQSFKSEADVLIESNPYQRRNTVNSEIILRLNQDNFVVISCNGGGYKFATSNEIESYKQFILIETDSRLLYWILQGPKKAHWNNAEIGSHIQFKRIPDIYERGLMHCLNYFYSGEYAN